MSIITHSTHKRNWKGCFMYTLGIDIGSTTVKVAVLDKDNKILFSDYKRHFANIKETLKCLVQEAKDALGENEVNRSEEHTV